MGREWTGALLVTVLAMILAERAPAAFAEEPKKADGSPWVHTFKPVRELYVAPDGKGSGAKADDAMSLAAAIQKAQPGDLYWLLAGTYKGDFKLTAGGTRDKPIVYRASPGARATLEGGDAPRSVTLEMGGSYNWVWGLEVTDPALRDHPIQAGGPGVHIINNIIHNGGGGIGGWMTGPDHVYYGNIIYGVGGDVNPPQKRTNYPTYTQSDYDRDGYKYFVQNMFFDGRPFNPNFNFHGYTEGSLVSGFYLVGNITANGRFLIGGRNKPHHHEVVVGNYFYNVPQVQLGYARPIQAEFRDNYLGRSFLSIPYLWGVGVGTGAKAFVKPLPSVITGNTIVYPPGVHVSLRTSAYVGEDRPDGKVPIDPKDTFDHNTYAGAFKGSLFANGKQGELDLAGWQRETAAAGKAFDAESQAVPAPTAPYVAVLRNEYEPGRGHVVVFNWSKQAAVTVDLSSVVTKGAAFKVHKAKDVFGAPLAEGAYDGPVSIPMGGEEFGAFLVTSEGGTAR